MKKLLLASLLAITTPVLAQPAPAPATPAAPAAPGRGAQAPLQIPNPRYETVSISADVNASADAVWARVGKFCDTSTSDTLWGGCSYLSGNGEPGTVRSTVNEVLVGTTKYSYTYVQPPRANTLYNFYHGTVMVTPLTPTTSRLNKTLFFDTSMLTEAARETMMANVRTRFTQQVQNMKILAEGGKLPAARTAATANAAPPAPFQNPNPRYVSIPMEVAVNAPADVVWSKIGHFCDIGKIGSVGFPTCMIVEGTDGEYGVVRSVAREVLVGKAANSYTYAQQMRTTGFYALYHGTIEARAVTPTTSTLYWTLVFDNSTQPDEAAIARDIANRRTRFLSMMAAVKTLAEGGTLPEAAPPAPANRP
jgi:hypothetical protein